MIYTALYLRNSLDHSIFPEVKRATDDVSEMGTPLFEKFIHNQSSYQCENCGKIRIPSRKVFRHFNHAFGTMNSHRLVSLRATEQNWFIN